MDMHFGDNSRVLKPDYLDLYEGVHTDIVYSNRFDECLDLSTTYLGTRDMTRGTKVKAVKNFPISGATQGQWCFLLDMNASV